MRGGVYAVGGNVYLEDVVRADTVVARGGCPWGDAAGIEEDDPRVVCAYADLYLAAEHAVALDAAYLALLDGEALFSCVQHCAYGGYDDALACGHVRRSADDLQGFPSPYIDGRDVEVVGVLMLDAGQHLPQYQPLQAARDGLYLLDPPGLKADRGERLCYSLGAQIGSHIGA